MLSTQPAVSTTKEKLWLKSGMEDGESAIMLVVKIVKRNGVLKDMFTKANQRRSLSPHFAILVMPREDLWYSEKTTSLRSLVVIAVLVKIAVFEDLPYCFHVLRTYLLISVNLK